MIYRSLEQMVLQTAEGVRPPERLSVSEAASKYRMLNNPGSFVGSWRNEKTPYLVEPMDVLTSLDHTGMVFVGPARTGKSDMFFNWLTHTAICDPADMMVIHMTQATSRDWSKGDLSKAFRHSPQLGERVLPGRQNQNTHDVSFRSGMRLLAKWPTITELSGKTIPRLWLMDYDRMPPDVDGEGSPFDLSRKRAQTFGRFGMCVAESSPGFSVEDPKWIAGSFHEAPPTRGILALYNRGDRRRWYWRCPHCSEAFEPRFSCLSWPDSVDKVEAAEAAVMVCPSNGCIIQSELKAEINGAGRWIKDGQRWNADGTITGTARRSDIASFWMLGAAAAFQSWRGLVLNYLTALDDFERTGSEEALKTTVNVDQGMPYTPKSLEGSRLPEELKDRAEDWGGSKERPVVPPGTRFLVATVDVQARAFVVQVHGFGPAGDVWLVDMFKIRKSERLDDDGDPYPIDPAGYIEDWSLLTSQVVERTYPLGDGSGRSMQIKAVGCDSGGREGVTTRAYAWWKSLRDSDEGHHRRVRLVKGEGGSKGPRVRETFPDSGRKDRKAAARGEVPVLLVNTDALKDQVDNMLRRTETAGGSVHFPSWAENWLYMQLTSETRSSKGWRKVGSSRNEALDLLVYALALAIFQPIRLEQIDWDKPPVWAEDWDDNALVLDPADKEPGFVAPKRASMDRLAELGSTLS
jgi:phage terminase large subunit GpA-like protein